MNSPEIESHLKSISKRYHVHSSGWAEVFCPYCNDAIRKPNPSHGHLYVSLDSSFAHCFRCGTKLSLEKLLRDTGFQNTEILNLLKKTGNVHYQSSKTIQTSKIKNIQNLINNHYQHFPKDKLQQFDDYVHKRCLNINPANFYLLPILYQDKLMVQILNANGLIVANRFISNSKHRYLNSKERHLYFFQDINYIDECQSITLAEGAFDIINLFNYGSIFNNAETFYVGICGSDYKSTLTTLITNHLMIGKYEINIVFDKGVQFLNQIINRIRFTVNELNCEINLQFYLPIIGKDVSDVMLIKQIQ